MAKLFNRVCTKTYFGVKNFIHEEKGAVDLVAIVVLIGVAVALAIAFKGAIAKILKDLLTNISTTADDATATVNLGGGTTPS